MAVLGTSEVRDSRVLISNPPGILERWEVVQPLRLSGLTDLPSDVIVVVRGALSFEHAGCSRSTAALGVRHVAAGAPAAGLPTQTSVHRHNVTWTNAQFASGRAVPFQIITRLSNVQATDQVSLVGSIPRNGDPVASSQATVHIHNLSILAWHVDNLEAIGDAFYHGSEDDFGGPGFSLPMTGQGLHRLQGTNIAAGYDSWLVFWSSVVHPLDLFSTSLEVVEGGSTVLREYGKDHFGCTAHVTSAIVESLYSYGGHYVVDLSASGSRTIDLVGRTLGPSTNARLYRADVVAIATDVLDNFQTDAFGSALYGADEPFTDELVGGSHQGRPVVVLGQAIPGVGTVSVPTGSGGARIEVNGGASTSPQQEHYIYNHSGPGSIPERSPELLTAKWENTTGGEFIVQWTGQTNPAEPRALNPSIGALEYEVTRFAMANDGPPPDPVGVTPGPRVDVVPSKESVGLDELSALPVEPDATVEWSYLDEFVKLRTQAGYEIDWPALFAPVRTGRMRWSGLTQAELGQLADFFRDLEHAAFKWTDPATGSEGAYVWTTNEPDVSEQAGTYTFAGTVVELGYF